MGVNQAEVYRRLCSFKVSKLIFNFLLANMGFVNVKYMMVYQFALFSSDDNAHTPKLIKLFIPLL